jgi:hypothetical protein
MEEVSSTDLFITSQSSPSLPLSDAPPKKLPKGVVLGKDGKP